LFFPIVSVRIGESQPWKTLMSEAEKVGSYLLKTMAEKGCGICRESAEISHGETGWKMILEGFMEPRDLGKPRKRPRPG
jgi:hypothetical protein